jgi:hypothetical protein
MEHNFNRLYASGGEVGKLVRESLFSQYGLGPIETWPDSLCMIMNLIFSCDFPMQILWGRNCTILYNDAFIPICMGKHPRSLGLEGKYAWDEVWESVNPILQKVFDTGIGYRTDDARFFLNRSGYLEETYQSFSYSPIRGKYFISSFLVHHQIRMDKFKEFYVLVRLIHNILKR